MSNIIDLLLNTEVDKIERPFKIIEIPRLSQLLGGEFKVMCRALTVSKHEDIQEMCINKKTNEIDVNKMQMKTVIEGVLDLEGKWLFKNKDIQKKFKAPTPDELVKKLLLSGEMAKLFEVIADLTGFGEGGIIEEVKN